MNEFSKNWIINVFSKVQKTNSSKEFSIDLIEGIGIKVILRYENDTYKGTIISNINQIKQSEIEKIMNGELIIMKKGMKGKFIEEMFKAGSAVKKRLIEIGLVKTGSGIDIDFEEIEKVNNYDFVSVDELDSSELEELGIVKETEESKRKKEKEKKKFELFGELNIDIKDIGYEDERLGDTEVYISNILKFPIRENMILQVEPEFYVPYLYKIYLENIYEENMISFIGKGIVTDKILISLLKKLKILGVQFVLDNGGQMYDVQEHLESIIKNPYYGLQGKLAGLMKNDTCRFCGSSGFVELTYNKISTFLEVGGGKETKVVEPFKYHGVGTIEKVICGNCQRTLTTYKFDNKAAKVTQKDIHELFPDFKCGNCGINAFQDQENRRIIEVELSYPTLRKGFNAFKNTEETMELIKSGDIIKIYCQENGCKEKKSFYK